MVKEARGKANNNFNDLIYKVLLTKDSNLTYSILKFCLQMVEEDRGKANF